MVVRMRHTRAHTGNRRSHHALTAPAISNSPTDGLAHRHRVSPVTGKYKGVQVIDMTKGDAKKSAKTSAKAEAKSSKKIAAKSESKKEEKAK